MIISVTLETKHERELKAIKRREKETESQEAKTQICALLTTIYLKTFPYPWLLSKYFKNNNLLYSPYLNFRT